MFGFLKRFQKECVDIYDDLERAKALSEFREHNPARAVINGLMYDTSKSEKIISFNNYPSFWIQTLYRTKNQRFFIVDEYRNIRVTTEDEAKEILSRYPGKYQEVFGKVDDA